MPLPTHTPPLSPLKRVLLAAAAVLIVVMAYAAYLVATFPYSHLSSLVGRCSMTVTVVSTHEAGSSQFRIAAVTDSGEAIEVTGVSRPVNGDKITVWRSSKPDGRFTYEMLEGIPPLR